MNLNQEKKDQQEIVTTTNVIKKEKFEDQSDKIFIKGGKNDNFINENKSIFYQSQNFLNTTCGKLCGYW